MVKNKAKELEVLIRVKGTEETGYLDLSELCAKIAVVILEEIMSYDGQKGN